MPSSKNWRCNACQQTANALALSTAHGAHISHQRLCLGLDCEGKPLGIPTRCLGLHCSYQPSQLGNAKTWETHYYRIHGVKLADQDLLSLRLRFQKELLPDVDLNSGFGTFYSRESPISSSPDLTKQWKQYGVNPNATSAQISSYLQTYRNEFWGLFQAVPVSFHSRVSDVTPQVIGSTIQLIQHSAGFASPKMAFTKAQRDRCGIAVLSGTYGSTHGSQAYHSAIGVNRDIACGLKPTMLDISIDDETLRQKIKNLRRKGYIGILVEMVSADGGRVLPPEKWNLLAVACQQSNLFLIVDEALTAVRCGAPFAFQRPEYATYGPSFVLFGKGIRVSGLAINPRGVTISNLGLERDQLMEFCTAWADRLPSLVLPFPVLLESLGTLRLIQKQNFPERSKRIGLHLRQLILQFCGQNSIVTGLDALIYMGRDTAAKSCFYGAAAGSFIRWLPFLDGGMDAPGNIEELFKQEGRSLRRKLSSGLTMTLCVVCSDYPNGEVKECATCSNKVCAACWNTSQHYAGTCLEFSHN